MDDAAALTVAPALADPVAPADPAARNLRQILHDLDQSLSADPDAPTIALRDVVAAMEQDSFPVLLLVFSLLLVSPLSAVPGATSLFGLTLAAILAQKLLRRRQAWLPAILLDRHLPAARTRQALRWLDRPAVWLDRRLTRRLAWVFRAPIAQGPVILAGMAALCAPLMEVIPGSGTSVGAAIALFSAGLLARDGLFVLTGACLAAILPVTLWLLVT
jgi:hypothetical protein